MSLSHSKDTLFLIFLILIVLPLILFSNISPPIHFFLLPISAFNNTGDFFFKAEEIFLSAINISIFAPFLFLKYNLPLITFESLKNKVVLLGR